MTLIDSSESRRLFSAGQPLDTFGSNGSVSARVSLHSYHTDTFTADADDEGRIVIAGLFRSKRLVGLTRLNADGSVDRSFGTDGLASIRNVVGKDTFGPLNVTIDHRGKVLVLIGSTLYRVNETGELDTTFDKDGKVTVPIVRQVTDVTVDAKNRPVIAGVATGKAGDRGTILRLGVKGDLDKSFGDNGAYKRPVPIDKKRQIPGDSQADGVKVLADGSIVAAGGVQLKRVHGVFVRGVDIWRMTANGTLDKSYGNDGVVRLTPSSGDGYLAERGLAAFTDDGGVYTQYNKDFDPEDDGVNVDPQPTVPGHLITYTDPQGHTGHSVQAIPPAVSDAYKPASTVVAERDGRAVVYASAVPAVYRLNADLTLDASFEVTKPPTLQSVNFSRSVLIASGDRMLVIEPTYDHYNTTGVFSVVALEA